MNFNTLFLIKTTKTVQCLVAEYPKYITLWGTNNKTLLVIPKREVPNETENICFRFTIRNLISDDVKAKLLHFAARPL